MADPNSLPYQANADPDIWAARGIRTSPSPLAQIAALNAADDVRTASAGTMTGSSAAGGHPWSSSQPVSGGTPAPSALATALANAPMPPVRPADLGVINALATSPLPPSQPAPVQAVAGSDQAVPPAAFTRAPSNDGVYDEPAPVGPDPWMAGAINPAQRSAMANPPRMASYDTVYDAPAQAMANPPPPPAQNGGWLSGWFAGARPAWRWLPGSQPDNSSIVPR